MPKIKILNPVTLIKLNPKILPNRVRSEISIPNHPNQEENCFFQIIKNDQVIMEIQKEIIKMRSKDLFNANPYCITTPS